MVFSTLDKSGASSVPERDSMHLTHAYAHSSTSHIETAKLAVRPRGRSDDNAPASPTFRIRCTYAMAPYPSKYVRKYVHFNQRSRAIAPSSLCWPLISLIYLLFMNSLPLLFSFSLYLSLFSSTFIFLAQHLQLYRLLLLNVLLATPARNNLSWPRGNC